MLKIGGRGGDQLFQLSLMSFELCVRRYTAKYNPALVIQQQKRNQINYTPFQPEHNLQPLQGYTTVFYISSSRDRAALYVQTTSLGSPYSLQVLAA